MIAGPRPARPGSSATPPSSGTGSPRWRPTPDNAPLVIERAEGRELIDADGRRYLDAISSLWVNTLGHRVPELDAALAAQAGKVAHSTMLGNGNTVVVELAEALARVVPVDDPHFLFAADGAVAVEQALKIAFQYWVNRGVRRPHAVPRARRRVPRRHHRLALARRRRRVQRRLRAAVLPRRPHAGLRRPGLGGQGLRRHRRPRRRAGRRRARAAGAGCVGHAVCLRVRRAADRRGVPPGRRPPDLRRGGDRVRAHGDAVRLRAVRAAARPAVPRQGDHRRVPRHVGHGGVGRGVRRLPRRRPRARRPSTTGTPTAGTRWRRRWRSSTCASSSPGTCWPTCGPGPTQLAIAPQRTGRRSGRRCARSASGA